MTDITNQTVEQSVTSDEKLLAMLSHLSIVLGGIILPIIVWATQKDKSKFVRFHSLQAIFYHIAYAVLIVLFIMVVALVFIFAGFGSGAFDVSSSNSDMPAFFVIGMILAYGLIFLFIFAGIGYAIYLAVKAYKGMLIKIPIIGNIIYKKVYG